jgi:hypothetical protein
MHLPYILMVFFFFLPLFFFETAASCVAQAGLELTVLLPHLLT